MSQPGHPRESGEHPVPPAKKPPAPGSSPRARGTPPNAALLGFLARFIPASAGNTGPRSRSPVFFPVHPRERGEHRDHTTAADYLAGSSPRARGTLRHRDFGLGRLRFIPASAGNTPASPAHEPARSVHPRERGEHISILSMRSLLDGSSPRARGTRRSMGSPHSSGRFIPASAGNTMTTSQWLHPSTVHPRERGEHGPRSMPSCSASGSSPRARGTPAKARIRRGYRRFIPASAGNTSRRRPCPGARAVHPRERGEHDAFVTVAIFHLGSSPRARGTLAAVAGGDRAGRFIPASAGNTSTARPAQVDGSVHPRERGEHPPTPLFSVFWPGSSPRARGTPCRRES